MILLSCQKEIADNSTVRYIKHKIKKRGCVIITGKYEKEVCQCRKCGMVFHQNEIKHIQVERFGQQVTESVCPQCGSNTYGLIDYPVDERELIYKNGKFFIYSGKELIHILKGLI